MVRLSKHKQAGTHQETEKRSRKEGRHAFNDTTSRMRGSDVEVNIGRGVGGFGSTQTEPNR
ncbi:hypothetical protein SESBI_49645 [Sesbania bispinosa]|nr:hypothetical protein SESBI_49645 [Sesbania bispinosa]